MEDKGINHLRIVIEKPFWQKDPFTNQRTEGWREHRVCKGHFIFGKGSEDYKEPVFLGMKEATAMVRKNSSKPITSEMRVIAQNQTWAIKGVSFLVKGRVPSELLRLELIENLVNDGNSNSRY